MLKLIKNGPKKGNKTALKQFDEQSYKDHLYFIDKYFGSQEIRNFSAQTIKKEKNFLQSWFKEHGDYLRPLYTWEAMEPITGRKRIIDYSNTLINNGISNNTIRSYLGILARYFSFVLEFPFIVNDKGNERIDQKYNPISQVVSEYYYPKHVYNGEKKGIPLDPKGLYDFFSFLRNNYLSSKKYSSIRSRNYCLVVLAGESGLRIDELLKLELKDLFFESKKIQTRNAKATRGSGKRARTTLFTPLAQDTSRFYIKKIRPALINNKSKNDLLFLSKSGQALKHSTVAFALKEMVNMAMKDKFPIATHMSWHWFRRIFATRFIEKFPNQLSILVSLLGHTTPNTVHCYILHSEAWIDEQIKKVLERGIK